MADQYFDLRGLCAYSSLGLSSIRTYIKNHGLPHYAVRNEKGAVTKILVKKSEFDSWMVSRWRTDLDEVVDSVMREIL